MAYICSREHTESEDLVVQTPRAFSKIIPRLFDIILEHFDVLRDQLSLGFHKVVQGEYAGVVKLVLEMGKPGVESKESDQTPFSWASRCGHEEVVKLLLEKSAELESKDDRWGQTPLSWAARGRA